MNLVNTTQRVAGFTTFTDNAGRESLVVIVKGTYGIPSSPTIEPTLLAEQVPLVTSDILTGKPGLSAPLYEIDFAPPKPRCDVLLNGSCHAPGGEWAQRVEVSLRVGSLRKSFRVVGPRRYEGSLICTPGEPRPFKVLPISYDTAFGGVDRSSGDSSQYEWYSLNHAGTGYYPSASIGELQDKPLPNTEEIDNPVRKPNGRYVPMAFGAIGRAWQQRIRWAGTYDQSWLDKQFPFLPKDFDTRYFQAAPEDQQIDHPRGGEEVTLIHLTPQGRTLFRLPAHLNLPVVFFGRKRELTEVPAVVDTVLIEPDRGRFSLVWRAAKELQRNLREVTEIRVGVRAQDIQRERARRKRQRDKVRYPSLAEAVFAAKDEGR